MGADGPGWVCLGVPIDSVGAPAGRAAVRDRGGAGRPAATAGCRPGSARPTSATLDVRVDRARPRPGHRHRRLAVRAATGHPAADGGRRTCSRPARPLLLGGCCALVMGAVAGARDALGRVGLVNVDGHVDAYDEPHLAHRRGRRHAGRRPARAIGWPDLLDAMGPAPVVGAGDAVVLGARDHDEAADLGDLPDRLGIVVRDARRRRRRPGGRRPRHRRTVRRRPASRYWLHLDVDVLDEDGLPGHRLPDAGRARPRTSWPRSCAPLGADPNLLGFSVGCYNPSKDPDGRCGDALVDLLVGALAPDR